MVDYIKKALENTLLVNPPFCGERCQEFSKTIIVSDNPVNQGPIWWINIYNQNQDTFVGLFWEAYQFICDNTCSSTCEQKHLTITRKLTITP